MTDPAGCAKCDDWKAVEGKSSNEAMQAYVDLIDSLKQASFAARDGRPAGPLEQRRCGAT